MQFLKELWLILTNVPSLAHRYEGRSLLGLLFLGLSVVATVTKNKYFDSKSTTRTILKWTSNVSLVLTAVAFILAFVDLATYRLPLDDLVCTDFSIDAYYYLPQDQLYQLVKRERCTNRTDNPIRELSGIRDGYYEDIHGWQVESKLFGDPPFHLVIHQMSEEQKAGNKFSAISPYIYVHEAKAIFEPALPSGSSFDLIYRISASGAPVEASAFSNEGTVFATGVDYDTLNYFLTIHAPSGQKIDLWDYGIVDHEGKNVPSDTDRQEKPQLSLSGNLLQWHLTLARKHLRYKLKFRFEEYGWQ